MHGQLFQSLYDFSYFWNDYSWVT